MVTSFFTPSSVLQDTGFQVFLTKVPFNNETASCLQKDTDIFSGIISVIQTNQQWLVRQLAAHGNRLPQKCRGITLTMLFALAQLRIN